MATWDGIFRKHGKFFEAPQSRLGEIIRLVKLAGGKRVLDLGCGSGRHTVEMAKAGLEVYATDISETGLRLTREWLEETHCRAVLKSASCYERFPFKSGFFDAVISTQVIHHNYRGEIRKCISEIRRVLKPKGIAYITVAGRKHNAYGSSKFEKLAERTYMPLDGEEKGIVHYIYTKKRLLEDLGGFETLDFRRGEEGHLCFLGKLPG